MAHVSSPRRLWDPPDPNGTLAYKFMQEVNRKRGTRLDSWNKLHTWSVNNRATFWEELLQQHPVIHSGTYAKVVDEDARMDAIPAWFDGVKVNFAENSLLWPDPKDASKGTTYRKEDHLDACIEVREGGTEIRPCTWKELRERVGHLSNAMRAKGVRSGDRVAVVASNSIDTLTVFYAVTALGGIFSSSSPDMGTKGVLDRLRQITPKYVFVDDWALYNGRTFDLKPKMNEIAQGMSGVSDFKGIVSMPRDQKNPTDVAGLTKCETLKNFLEAAKGDRTLRFQRMDFSSPFIIVYSSGTTGLPKCITHTVGGAVLNVQKEHRLHRDALLHPAGKIRTLQFTTTGWIMYLSSCQAHVNGATVILYDGSPFQPGPETLLKLTQDLEVTDLGISPRWLQTLATAKPKPILPREIFDLSKLRHVTSTGMVLSEAQFEWFYDKAFPAHVQLDNISGGTDVAACFVMANTMQPVYVGGCVGPALGMKIEAYDQTAEGGRGAKGRPVPLGEAGELVCTAGFPTQPAKFWDDLTGEKYFKSYFERFDNVWTHGDFISFHPKTNQVFLHGRADGVLNPSGVRFGSAEIYSVVDRNFPDEVQDSICVGQRRPQDPDESVMLFLLMKAGKIFSQDLVKRVKAAIARDCGKRCVPKYVFETPEIPKVELPVKQIVSGKVIKPSNTLANKDCLNFYYQFAKVEELVPATSKL